MMKLSEQQEAVLNWCLTGFGSLNLEARAGCGKTSTLLELVIQIIARSMGTVLLCAFNKSIATEIGAKLTKRGVPANNAQSSTLHAVGFAAWRKATRGVRVEAKKVDFILDDLVAAESDPARREFVQNSSSMVKKLVSFAKGRGLGFFGSYEDKSLWYAIAEDHDLDELSDRIVMLAMDVYEISLKQCHKIIDFDDMILAPLYFKSSFDKYDWVMLDEAQDTSPTRRAIALASMKPSGRLIAVGDPFQAIYAFAGASNGAMKLIADELNSETLFLTRTYRCAKAVVSYANNYVPDIEAAEGNAQGLVRRIDFGHPTRVNAETGETVPAKGFFAESLTRDDAVLCRNTKPLIELAYGLLRQGIGCRVEGRDIGEGLIKLAKRWKLATLRALSDKLVDYRDREVTKWQAKNKPERAQQVEDACDTLEVLINVTTSKGGDRISDLETTIRSLFGDTEPGQKPKVLTLCTLHRSKGREWNRVYLLGTGSYCPSKYARSADALQQESNLVYVGITRAINELVEVEVQQ